MYTCASSSCCGLHEISELRDFEKPADALWNFLQNHVTFPDGRIAHACLDNMLPYQVFFDGVQRFTEPKVPEVINREEYYTEYRGRRMFRQESYDAAVEAARQDVLFGYAGRFAAFLRRGHFGRVFAIPTQPNHNYLDHIIEVYIWHPNHMKLRAWYQQERKRRDSNGNRIN